MQVANKTQLKLEQEKGSVCLFKCVFVFCVCDVLLHRAYFSSPYSLSSDRSSKAPPPSSSKHLETGTRRGEREDGWERKGAMRWGRKRMERKEREDRRRAEAETAMERQQNGKELTNEWNQTKGGEVLD